MMEPVDPDQLPEGTQVDICRVVRQLGGGAYGTVDLVEKDALENPFRRREILRTHRVVYSAEEHAVAAPPSHSPAIQASMERAHGQARRGEFEDLGSFAQFADADE